MSKRKTSKVTESNTGRKRAALYARVSKEEQAAENTVSISEQKSHMLALCERNGWQVVGEYVDSKDYKAIQSPKRGKMVNPSGERADRPELLKLLARAQTGEIDIVVCWRDDRLVRHPRVASVLEDALDLGDKARGNRGKIQVMDATGAEIDRFVLHIKAVIGREENKRRVERIRLGKDGTLKAGHWPGTYNRLGYKTVKEAGKRGNIIVLADRQEVQLVKDIFNWYDAGIPLREICRKLIERGAEQKGSHRQRRYTWSPVVIDHILASEDYTGKATWRFDDGMEYTIKIPQIISPEQWQRVQGRLAKNRVLSTRNSSGVYLLQGIIFCGECDGRVGVNQVRYLSGRRRKDGTRWTKKLEIPQFNYRCNTARVFANEPHLRQCNWSGDKLDDEVWHFVVEHGIKHPELIREQVLNRQAALQAQAETVTGDIAHVRTKLAEIEQERANYQRQQARGKISEAEFDARMQETDDEAQHWQAELDRLTELRDNADTVSLGLEYTTRLMATIERQLPKINQDRETLNTLPHDERQAILKIRQAIIRALCDKVTIWASGKVVIDGLLDGSELSQFEYNSQMVGRMTLTQKR